MQSCAVHKARILVVEDDPVLNLQLTSKLEDASYQVDRCFDGEQGLSMATQHRHQLILLDVMLPKRDGFSLLGMLRKTCRTPVIILSAKGAEEEQIRGLSQGTDDYLVAFNTT